MDLRLVQGNKDTQLKEILDRALSMLNTGLPGVVISFDPSTRTCEVQPGIQMKVTEGGTTSFESLPLIVNAPVELPYVSVAGFYITLPIRAGDPCWIKFSQRAIDNWFAEGGIQPPGDGDAVGCRHHDLTDAVITFAPSTLSDVLADWEANGIELRNRARTSRVTIKDTTVTVAVGTSVFTVSSDGTISITGTLTVSGALKSNTSVADTIGTLASLRAAFNSHTHMVGSVQSSPPTPLDPAA